MSTLVQLRQEAKTLKVKNWWTLSKTELESCITVKKEEARIEAGEPAPSIHDASNKIISQAIANGDIEVPVSKAPIKEDHESVEEYLARGGKITELPSPAFPAPKPTRESSAMKSPKNLSQLGITKERRRPTKTKAKVIAEAQDKLKRAGKGPVIKDADTVSLSTLVEEAGIEARIARRRLRGSDIEKPGAQWEWPVGHKDIAKVKELLK